MAVALSNESNRDCSFWPARMVPVFVKCAVIAIKMMCSKRASINRFDSYQDLAYPVEDRVMITSQKENNNELSLLD